MNNVSTTGESSPGQGVHPEAILDSFDGTSNEEQHDEEKGATWRVKDRINTKENTIHQSKEDGRKQPTTNRRTEQAGVNGVNGQIERTSHKAYNVDTQIPPPIKVSSNFNAY
ncbi:hypothetical protein RDI58_022237 [Solanum bulbocastanum]|uniref:Uncharacterized protein n=1 Tax=Solanum bulbocastanum TaxID=147425 RepID=A0AAN8T8Z0_SOLBU